MRRTTCRIGGLLDSSVGYLCLDAIIFLSLFLFFTFPSLLYSFPCLYRWWKPAEKSTNKRLSLRVPPRTRSSMLSIVGDPPSPLPRLILASILPRIRWETRIWTRVNRGSGADSCTHRQDRLLQVELVHLCLLEMLIECLSVIHGRRSSPYSFRNSLLFSISSTRSPTWISWTFIRTSIERRSKNWRVISSNGSIPSKSNDRSPFESVERLSASSSQCTVHHPTALWINSFPTCSLPSDGQVHSRTEQMCLGGDDDWQRGKVSVQGLVLWDASSSSPCSKIYVEPSRNGFASSEITESADTPSNSQVTNGFAIPHSLTDSDSIVLESQAGSTTNSQLGEEMEQENNDDDETAEEEEEEEDKPSSSSSPTNNLTDENSSSSNSNSTPLPSSSTEDMIEQ